MDPSSKNLSWKWTLCIWNHLWQDVPHVDYLYLFWTRLLLAWLSNTSVSPWKRQWTADPNVSSHTVTDFFSFCHFLLSTVSFPSKSPMFLIQRPFFINLCFSYCLSLNFLPVLLQPFGIDRTRTMSIIQGVDFFDDLIMFCLLCLVLYFLLYNS